MKTLESTRSYKEYNKSIIRNQGHVTQRNV